MFEWRFDARIWRLIVKGKESLEDYVDGARNTESEPMIGNIQKYHLR